MLVNDVVARIDGRVVNLARRVKGAAELAELVKQNSLPQVTPAAFVLPLGFRYIGGEAGAGMYTQDNNRIVSVVIIVKVADDKTGAKALPTIAELEEDVINAVAGWAPGDEVGVFVAMKGELVSLSAGAVIYQIDFAIQEQLRIAS
jgi:hypothetical protein